MVDSIGEKGSRLLDDTAMLCDLLRMAFSMGQRMQQDLHGESYEKVSEIARQLQDLRAACNSLFDEVAREVGEMESGQHQMDPASHR